MSDLADILRKAKALIDCVTFDDCGQVIGTHLVGGNGGLLSRETIKAADALRQALNQHERHGAEPDPSSGDEMRTGPVTYSIEAVTP
jgi:hypothetical protein